MRGLFVRCEYDRIRRRRVRRQQALNLGRIQPAVGPNLSEFAKCRDPKGQRLNKSRFLCGGQARIRLRTKARDVHKDSAAGFL